MTIIAQLHLTDVSINHKESLGKFLKATEKLLPPSVVGGKRPMHSWQLNLADGLVLLPALVKEAETSGIHLAVLVSDQEPVWAVY